MANTHIESFLFCLQQSIKEFDSCKEFLFDKYSAVQFGIDVNRSDDVHTHFTCRLIFDCLAICLKSLSI